MALILFEGFSAGTGAGSGAGPYFLGKWDAAVLEVSGGKGRHGVGGGGTSGSYILQKILNAAQKDDTLIIGCALKNPSAAALLTLGGDVGATTHLTFAITGSHPNEEVAVYRGTTAGTLLGTSSGAGINVSGWRYVEIEAHLDNSSGSVKVWSDGILVLDLTGIDTRNAGTDANFDFLSFSSFINNIDDLYILNGLGGVNDARLGDCRVAELPLSGNGASSQWTGSDGNSTDNYQLVDDYLGGSDYVDAAVSDLVDTYDFGDVTLSADDRIISVGIHARALKTDTGARSLALVSYSAGTTDAGTDQPLSDTTTKTYFEHFDTDPDTGIDWTEAGHNASQAGIKSRP
jgi:hypothetical protein